MRVKLKTKSGQFWDRRLRWGIVAGEVKDLPEPLSQDTLTYQKLRMGGFEIIKDAVASASAPEYTTSMNEDSASTQEYTASVPSTPESAPENDPGHTATPAEPETERQAETPASPPPKPAPKKRGRPKKTSK